MADLAYLKELKDIHLPLEVSIWPLAWGFWVLLAMLPFMFYLYRLFKPSYDAFKTRKEYLSILKNIEANPSPQSLAEIAFLLKRAALFNYPREEVAALHGEKWLSFLSHSAKHIQVDEARIYFSQLIYQPAKAMDIKPAIKLAHSWLVQQRFRPCTN